MLAAAACAAAESNTSLPLARVAIPSRVARALAVHACAVITAVKRALTVLAPRPMPATRAGALPA